MVNGMRDIPIEKIEAVKRNIIPAAHAEIEDWNQFDWHRSGSGVVDSDVAHSSQAFCVSVWGSLAQDSLGSGFAYARNAASLGSDWEFMDSPGRLSFEFSDRTLLNELGTPQATSIDVMLEFDNHVMVIESKLTEELGRCNQAKSGACSGNYAVGSDLKTGTDALCRLEIQDGARTPRLYWDVMRSVITHDALSAGTVCPFADSAYQVMRNVSTAVALGRRNGKDWRALFAFPAATRHDTAAVVASVAALLAPESRSKVAVLDYAVLAEDLTKLQRDDARGLAVYMQSRLSQVQ
jgi:hypothetical protein